MIIGSGSASFEILRYLVERLPVMVTPRWVATECQPIAIRNVLGYLVACLRVPETAGRTLDIGGADVLTYRELMHTMARERGLRRRLIVPVPVLTPRLSSLWIHLVTPLSRQHRAAAGRGPAQPRGLPRRRGRSGSMPQPLLTAREAIRAALDSVARDEVETIWSEAGACRATPTGPAARSSRTAARSVCEAPPEAVFRAVCRIGGGHGWYAADGLWRLRGALDRLVGGPGLRRGRRDPETCPSARRSTSGASPASSATGAWR